MTQWELRALGSLQEIKSLLASDHSDLIRGLHTQSLHQLTTENIAPVACAGNQHTCRPTMFIPAMQKSFDLVLTGTGDSKIIGHPSGPRALVWANTELNGSHPDLGKLRVTLEPTEVHAGTLVPLTSSSPLPGINRNTYFFVLEIENVGELISERPAIVEALIDQIPPRATYRFLNPPLNFYLRSDPTKTVVAVLEHATTDVEPM